ncbi:MAG: hypothetical protein OXE99_03970 [Cellvibrionales bacterium]|nr:hypothetical protein [Cellvibrionales bacterium]
MPVKKSVFLHNSVFFSKDELTESTDNTIDRAATCVRKFFETSEVQATDIDLVVYCSQAFTSDGPLRNGENIIMDNYYNVSVNSKVLFGNDLGHVQIHGFYSSISGDWLTAIRIARNFILAEGMKNVLVVVIDDPNHITPENHSVDVAAFCISDTPLPNSWNISLLEHYQALDNVDADKNINRFIDNALVKKEDLASIVCMYWLDSREGVTRNKLTSSYTTFNDLFLGPGEVLSGIKFLNPNKSNRAYEHTNIIYREYKKVNMASFTRI